MEVLAQDVINSLNNPTDILCLRILDDRKDGIFKGLNLSCEAGKFSTMEEQLRAHNAMNHGIFFVVNTGGHDDDNITRINAQFVEMDDESFEEQQKKIDAFPLQPSMIIKTRRSLHTYWFVKSAEVPKFRPIQKALVKHFHGDPHCVNESRVMRLPGFYHCKQDPYMVECISFHPEYKYTQDQFAQIFPDMEDEVPVPQMKGTENGLKIVMHSCDFLKHCRDDAATLSEHDWYAMITNLAPFEGGTELIHELSKPYDGYSVNATQKKINHFIESKTKPITCKVIAEKGFKCPKLETGECGCKSPAALCYRPLTVDGLRDLLAEITITGDTLEDMRAARNYIETYLFNQDAVMAETIINHDMKEKFKLKGADLKPLLTYYKECAKEYKNGLETRKARVEFEGIPLWYDFTSRGLKFMPGILADNMSETENVIYAAEQYYIYHAGVYEEMSDMEAQRMVQLKMLPRETKMGQIIDAEHQWRLHVRTELRDLNANPFIINVRNGLYNVLEETLIPHSPEYYSTVQLGVNYDNNAKCPKFLKFLEESMGGDMEQVRLIQEMLGYFLIPVQSAQKCFVIVGAAGAGKSVLLRVLNEILLGRQNVSNVSWQALNERFKTAELFGKLANIFADLPTKNIDDNGIFKALVGEDYLTVEKKNKDPFSFQSCARLLFSCNSIPKNYGDRSEGFYRRLIIMRFNTSVPVEKRDPDLIDKFRTEADGIFLFALEGLKRLMKQHYRFSETQVNIDELQQYREDSDSVLSFVKDCCTVKLGSADAVGSSELFNAYKKYCEECGLKPYSQKAFVQQVITQVPGSSRGVDSTGRRRVINGIVLGEVLG